MHKKILALFLALMSYVIFATDAYAISGDAEIRGSFKNSDIILKTADRNGGAIYSLVWGGKEFLNLLDQGRSLQSTVSYNDHGGCLNPTEAGNFHNKPSQVLDLKVVGTNTIYTKNLMAYWMEPGLNLYLPRCGYMNRAKYIHDYAVNTTVFSTTQFSKKVTIGYKEMDNVIEYDVKYEIPETYDSIVFETLGAHQTNEFTKAYKYVYAQDSTIELDKGGGYAGGYNGDLYDPVTDQMISEPVILSTADGKYAMAGYSPDSSKNRYGGPWYSNWQYGIRPLGYGRWFFDFNLGSTAENENTIKWGILYSSGYSTPGNYNFRQFAIVGTLDDVKRSLRKLIETETESITRAEATKILSLEFNKTILNTQNPTFKDVNVSDQYYGYIERFAADGITSGCSVDPKLYCPDRLMTRAEVATFLLRLANKVPSTGATPVPYFDDVPSSHPLFSYIQLFKELNLTNGCYLGARYFCPNDFIRREDFQVLVSRVKSLNQSSDLNSDGITNIFDFNKLISGYNTIYNFNDYERLVSNFGK